MSADRVLVAFASRTGSTAALAEVIAAELAAAGLAVDCLAAGDVVDLAPYHAVVLGSGVFLPRRQSDGGGFLTRHAETLASREVWLFCAGPIGGARSWPGDPVAVEQPECAVVAVARGIGARGAAAFGCKGPGDLLATPPTSSTWDLGQVREWAQSIATELCQARGLTARAGVRPSRATPRPGRPGHHPIVVTR